MHRDNTKKIRIGDITIGGGQMITIQSMTNTKTEDIKSTISQIQELKEAGCEIIRCAVPNLDAAKALKEIKKKAGMPVVADIHFDYRLAIEAVKHGADKIRINPGNIGGYDKLKAVVDTCKERNIPIRVGVNSGSLEHDIIAEYGRVTAEGLVKSAVNKVKMIEDMDYDNIVVSIKATDVMMNKLAHELLIEKINYPLHVGITESGTIKSGSIKSSVGLSLILGQGIGDTVRVSLTGNPVEEIHTAKLILRSLKLRSFGIEVISCPTCGRTNIDIISLAERVEELVEGYDLNIKVAVMGCAVNGPGEAKEADIGIAGGNGEGVIIRKGEIIRKVPEDMLFLELKKELDEYAVL